SGEHSAADVREGHVHAGRRTRHGRCSPPAGACHGERHPIGDFMNKPLCIVLLLAGLALLVYGINATNSVASETSEALTGSPTNKAMWLMIGGGAAALLGLIGLIGSRGRHVRSAQASQRVPSRTHA